MEKLRAVLTAFGLALTVIVELPTTLSAQSDPLPDYVLQTFGPPPVVPNGPLPPMVQNAVDLISIDTIATSLLGPEQETALQTIAASNDPRLAWIIADMMRFSWQLRYDTALADTAASLLGTPFKTIKRWHELTDRLIAWDIPAYPGYLANKRSIFAHFVPGSDKVMTEGDVDWRLVSWGGVLIDDRPFGTTDEPCNCIPAADNPPVTSAEEATWLDEDDIVFGIEINGEARAYPRQIMEVREMVNDTLGGRDLGIPYCTLCGAAQAFFTDRLPAGVKRPVLRTSGLLSRSNKVMYDLQSWSVFDTFLGTALTGPLAKRGITLEQATVITSTWGEWKAAYPQTTVLEERLALGRKPDFRNTRDANGPIFPVGDVDPRLPIHEDVIGVIAASGTPIAFPRAAAFAALSQGQEVGFENIRLAIDAGGLRARDADGSDLGSHEAFWFAWSQFHPGTQLWTR